MPVARAAWRLRDSALLEQRDVYAGGGKNVRRRAADRPSADNRDLGLKVPRCRDRPDVWRRETCRASNGPVTGLGQGGPILVDGPCRNRRSRGRSRPRSHPSTSHPSHLAPEKRLFARDAPAVAAHRAVGPDDAMAGNEERHRVGRAGASDRARGGGLADGGSDLAIGAGLAVRDRLQLAPDAPLERGGSDVERQLHMRRPASQMRRAARAPGRSGCDRSFERSRADTPAGDRARAPHPSRRSSRGTRRARLRRGAGGPSGDSAIVKSISTPGAPLRYVAGVIPSAAPARSYSRLLDP